MINSSPVKTCILAAVVGIGLVFSVVAQPAWQWAVRGYSSDSHVYGLGIATDAQGNVYVAGKFYGTATFGDTNSPIASFGDSDAFLAKYSSQGQLQWAKKFGGTGYDAANAVAVDTNGNIYVAGRFGGPAAFGSFTLTNLSAGFTMKVNPATTNVVWAKSDGAEWFGVAASAGGNSHVVGDAVAFQIAGSKLAGPIALAKYDSGGVRQWYTNSLAPNLSTSGSGKAIAVDTNGNVYITGIFRRVVEFGATSLTNAATANNTRDEIFVAKFNTAGVPQWARRGGGEGDDQGLGIGVDGVGNAVVTGFCDNTSSLNGGTSVSFDIGGFILPGAVGGGLGNMFLARFNPSGTGLWARKLAGTSYGAAAAVVASGETYVAGHFRSTPLDFGGVALAKDWSNEEIFAVKYDPPGNAMWGRRSSSTEVGVRFGRAIAVAVDGSVYETGEYSGVFPVDFDGTTLGSKSTAVSMFVAKLAAPSAPAPSVQSLTLLGGGVIRLAVSGTAGQSYVIEASGTPGNFITIATNSLSGGILQFADPGWIGATARFYRLRLP